MHQKAVDLILADTAEVPHRRAHEIVQFGHDFHAGKSPSRHDESQQRTAKVRIGFVVGFFQGVQSGVAQAERIAQVAKGDGMIGQPGNA